MPVGGHFFQFTADALWPQPPEAAVLQLGDQLAEVVVVPLRLVDECRAIVFKAAMQAQENIQVRPGPFVPIRRVGEYIIPVEHSHSYRITG